MKKVLIAIILVSSPLHAATWVAGSTKFELKSLDDRGHVSANCERDCNLLQKVRKEMPKLATIDVENGKDPASGICKRVGAQVVYLSQGEDQDAFCVLGNDVISLSLLLGKEI